MKHRLSWGTLALVLALAFVLAATGGQLAQPETEGPENDRFIGYYLVCRKADGDGTLPSLEDENWTEYGSDAVDLGKYGSVRLPSRVLFAEDRGGGDYAFPGLDGLRFFFPDYTETADGEEQTIRGSCTDLDMTELSVQETDEGTQRICTGTLYYGPPLDDDGSWGGNDSPYVWKACLVNQRADGAVYLTSEGNSYGGANSSGFSFTDTFERTEQTGGRETKRDRLELTVNFQVIPRTSAVTVCQYGPDGTLLDRRSLSAAELLTQTEQTLPRAERAVWAVITQENVDGTQTRRLLSPDSGEDGEDGDGWTADLWLLDDGGRGRQVAVSLE